MSTSDGGSGVDDWGDVPTVSDSQHVTPTRDLAGVARALSSVGDHEDVLRMAYGEGQEDAIRALYALFRERGLTRPEMDHLVLAVRQRLTRL